MGSDEHHANASDIHGQLQLKDIRSACLQSPGLNEQHGRIEAVVLAGAAYGVFVTADCSKRGKFSAISAYHLVIEVPGLYAKGFRPQHPAPGIRSLECGKVQKAFIHYGKCVGHRLPALFLYLYGEFFLRVQDIRNCYGRRQV